jgi:hypothetical protein
MRRRLAAGASASVLATLGSACSTGSGAAAVDGGAAEAGAAVSGAAVCSDKAFRRESALTHSIRLFTRHANSSHSHTFIEKLQAYLEGSAEAVGASKYLLGALGLGGAEVEAATEGEDCERWTAKEGVGLDSGSGDASDAATRCASGTANDAAAPFDAADAELPNANCANGLELSLDDLRLAGSSAAEEDLRPDIKRARAAATFDSCDSAKGRAESEWLLPKYQEL